MYAGHDEIEDQHSSGLIFIFYLANMICKTDNTCWLSLS